MAASYGFRRNLNPPPLGVRLQDRVGDRLSTRPVVETGNGISPVDPAVAGGDLFDLATIGVQRARYIKIMDTGQGHYQGTTGGFDLDALAVINGSPVACW